MEIWPNVQTYIKEVLKPFKSKQPTSASFVTIDKATKDVLLPAKLQVFRWFKFTLKFTLKPPIGIMCDKLQLAFWDASFWTFLGQI